MTSPSPVPAPDGLRHAALPASGLPARILAVLRASGILTLGDLSRPLPASDKLDADDRALLARVAAYAGAACSGRPPALNLCEWLALFLPARLADTVHLHFGLGDPAVAIARHETRLRETGFKLGVTRERTRQLLGLAFNSLRQALPLHAAEPLFRTARELLHAAGGVLDPVDLAARRVPVWGGASPVGSFLLLAQLLPGRITRYRDFFSEFAPTLIERVEKALRDRLAAQPGLQPVASLAAGLPKSARPGGVPAEPLLLILLRHLPDALVTRDGRAGRAETAAAGLLQEVLATTGETALRNIVAAFNARLRPECQRGSGFVRDTLQREPRIRRTGPGRYALPGGLQTDLPLKS